MRVEIEDLHVGFPGRGGFQPAVRGVDLSLGTEKLAIVGESGSGKSLTARAIMRPDCRAGRVVTRAKTACSTGSTSSAPRRACSARSAAAAPG